MDRHGRQPYDKNEDDEGTTHLTSKIKHVAETPAISFVQQCEVDMLVALRKPIDHLAVPVQHRVASNAVPDLDTR